MKLTMQAFLSRDDVIAAVAAYVSQETGRDVDPASVVLTNDGASVSIGDAPEAAPATPVKRATRASKPAPEKTSEPVEQAAPDAPPAEAPPEEMTAEEAVEAIGGESDQPSEEAPAEEPVTAPAPKVPSLFANAVAPVASNDAPTPMPVKKAGGIFNFAKPQADASAQ